MAGKKLLVIDDSLTIQKVIRLALSNEGYEIQAVSNGNEALEQIALFRPDMVLIDHSLPGKSAFEIKEALNQDPEQTKIRCLLMVSAFEQVDESRVENSGFSGRLVKPFDPAHLREALNQLQSENLLPKSPNADHEDLDGPPAFVTRTGSMLGGEVVEIEDITDDPDEPALPPSSPPAFKKNKDLQDAASLKDDELWGKDTGSTAGPEYENDIKNLTESTIKMTGLDEYQWNLNEPIKTDSQAPDPIPLTPDVSEPSDFVGTSSYEQDVNLSTDSDEPSLAPTFNMEDRGDSSFDLDSPADSDEKTVHLHTASAADYGSGGIGDIDTNIVPLTSAQMEELIRKQLQETLEKMARQMLPEIAERLIKDEIQRMLTSPPG